MFHAALFAAVLASPSHAAAVAPAETFESSVSDALRRTRDAGLAARLNWLASDIRRFQQQATFLRGEAGRLRSRLAAAPPDRTDPGLAFDVRRMSQDFQQLARELRWKLQDARVIRSSIAGKDPDLSGPASYFASEVRWLANEARWLDMDVRTLGWDLRGHGFHFEAMDLETAVRDIQFDADALKHESDLITAKAAR